MNYPEKNISLLTDDTLPKRAKYVSTSLANIRSSSSTTIWWSKYARPIEQTLPPTLTFSYSPISSTNYNSTFTYARRQLHIGKEIVEDVLECNLLWCEMRLEGVADELPEILGFTFVRIVESGVRFWRCHSDAKYIKL